MFSLKQKYRLNNFLNLLFKERFKKKLNFNWNNYPQRFEVINKIIKKKNYKNYLEIGCFKDENFKEIIVEHKVGVDPVSGGTIRSTSDNFFKKNNKIFDIIFIDGLHYFDQVKKDIKNSLEALSERGIIIIHDCLPTRIRDQMIPRSHEHWNGDVWKVVVEFRTKINVDVYTCMADQGLGIILKKKNLNPLKLDLKDFKKLKFEDYYYNYPKFMNIISHEELFKII
jgi:predicted O-methyltransferase YrrM